MRICVIGAGAAGICAARRVQEDTIKNGILDVEIRIFEQSKQLGGTWVFDEAFDAHSSMYSNLRTNIPRELMAFDEFQFLASTPEESSFPESEKVLQYLAKFAQPIKHLIQFDTRVLCVRKLANEKWEVEFEQKCTKIVKSELFDAIFVCIGHYSAPRLPNCVTKLDKSKLEWIHSHQYRRAEHFAGKNVAVVGGGPSGCDIVLQLVKFAKKVYFLHIPGDSNFQNGNQHAMLENEMPLENIDNNNNTLYYFRANERPKNCEEGCRVVDATESSLILADGNELGTKNGLDAIIFCTGYRYSIPFLEKEGLIKCPDDGSYVSPIWAKCVHVHHPCSLFVIGLPFPVLPFQLFECQIRLVLALFHGRIQPPPIEEMLAEETDRLSDLKCKGLTAKDYYKCLPDPQWHYMDWLNKTSGFMKPRAEMLYEINKLYRAIKKATPCHYRNICFEIKKEN